MSKSKKIEFETFRPFEYQQRRDLEQSNPSCFNGMIRIHKIRITIEPIEEPIEILQTRVQDLWDHATSYHHWDPLKIAAKKLNYELVGAPGNKAEKKS
jgi:hypothetical protein